MARDKDTYTPASDGKPSSGRVARRDAAPDTAKPQARRPGRSGHGVESIRPYLRAQIEERNLLRPPFPPPDEPDKPSKPRGGK